jgi:hypothetical protein
MVAHFGGAVQAVKAFRVERRFYPSPRAGSRRAAGTPARRQPNRLFPLRPLKGAAAVDLPVVVTSWDQIELVRVLLEYTSC